MADLVMGAMGNLIPKLGELLKEEYKLQTDVKKRIRFLTRELEDLTRELEDVQAAVPWDQLDEQVKLRAREVREASYDMEDVLDTFLVGVHDYPEPEPVEEMGCSCLKRATKKMGDLPSKARSRGNIYTAIEDITKRLQEVADRCGRYRVDSVRPVTATSSAVDPRLPALYRNERELVGIEEAREAVVRLLTHGDDEKTQVKEVSIVGLAGVGKTTLAKAVYNSLLQAQQKFDCSAFVSVSQNPDLNKVLRDILLELDEANYGTIMMTKPSMDESQLSEKIREFLRNKRYLIAIDDIWDAHSCEIIRLALVDNHLGSRIITTSRNCSVGASGFRVMTSYWLKPLSHVNSEKLFYKRMFGGEGKCPDSQLAEVSEKILKKCGGLPLAIITAACLLASKPWDEWSEVCNSVALMRKERNRYIDNMRMVLSFSIQDLPSHLKTCLLHLGVFPEDCWIEKDFLIWKWVAEGFVQHEETSLFETGESYFNDLVNRSMIQVEEGCFEDHVYGCRVHPSVFSLIRSTSSEENFCTVLGTSPGSNNSVRRIGLHTRNAEDSTAVDANMSMRQVRSFNASLCFIDWMPQLSSFQVLRVLALEYCPGMDSHHLKLIGNLLLLTYLGLVGAGVLELPEETLGGLRFLQTLDLRETGIEQWPGPSIMSKLRQLMCLCVGRTRTVPNGIEWLMSLEDLRLHHVSGGDSAGFLELGRLESLRVLLLGFEQMDVELEKALVESLGKLSGNIQRLEIYSKSSTKAVMWEETNWVRSPEIRQLVVGGLFFSRLPQWINPSRLPKLSRLQLVVEVVEDRDLEILGAFPELRSLMVVTTAAIDEQKHRITPVVVGSDHAFMVLNFFSINMAVRFLQSGHDGRPPMPKLEHLELRVRVAQCADSWLSTLANLPSLDNVTVVLDCRGASAAETEDAKEWLRHAADTHANRPSLEVTHVNDEVPLVEQFRFKNPQFEAMRREMEIMQANRRVQVQPDSDSDEIAPAKEATTE